MLPFLETVTISPLYTFCGTSTTEVICTMVLSGKLSHYYYINFFHDILVEYLLFVKCLTICSDLSTLIIIYSINSINNN